MKIVLHLIFVTILTFCSGLRLTAQEKMDNYITLGTEEKNIISGLSKAEDILNTQCDHAISLKVNETCKANNYLFEKSKAPSSSDHRKIEAWYNFIAPETGHVSIISNPELADNIEVFAGNCENLIAVNSIPNGQQIEVKDLLPGHKYLLRINTTVASFLMNNCITIKEVVPVLPAYQNCLNAKTVTIGDICTPGNNQYNKFSGPKPSCVPYAEANVWYSVTAPESGSIKLNSGADFYHVLAVYSGRCDSLVEIFCSKNPQKCNGYLEVRNLFPGQQYYVQIASAQGPFGYNFGNFCLEILDGNAADTYIPIKLNTGITCVGEGYGHINYTINGGKGKYTIEGNSVEDVLHTGQQYGIVVKDEWGCEVSFFDKFECGAFDCQLTAVAQTTDVKCPGDINGIASIKVFNETGNVSYQWSTGQTTQEIRDLAAGTYTVTVTDDKNCQLINTVVVNEAKPIAVEVDEIVSESAFSSNGSISVSPSGGTQPYTFNWTKNNVPVSSNRNLICVMAGLYDLSVIDNKGCNLSIHDLEISNNLSNAYNDELKWSVYPVPADKELSVKINSPLDENITISLLDPKGKLLKFYQFRSHNIDFNLPIKDTPSGLYLLQLKSGEITDQRKVIIQR